jgi:hypothetical protein
MQTAPEPDKIALQRTLASPRYRVSQYDDHPFGGGS